MEYSCAGSTINQLVMPPPLIAVMSDAGRAVRRLRNGERVRAAVALAAARNRVERRKRETARALIAFMYAMNS